MSKETEKCLDCGADLALSEGEGYDGRCGDCADKAEADHRPEPEPGREVLVSVADAIELSDLTPDEYLAFLDHLVVTPERRVTDEALALVRSRRTPEQQAWTDARIAEYVPLGGPDLKMTRQHVLDLKNAQESSDEPVS